MAADIDARFANTLNDGTGFAPISIDAENGFSGSFVNSNDYVITGLTIDRPEISNVGLFSRLAKGATLRGVILMDVRTTGLNNVGSLVGISNGTILDSSATGIVSGGSRVGGLVGLNDDAGRVSRSSATGTVSGNEHVGGLVGRNLGGTIEDSRSLGSVTGDSWVGGLVGENLGGTIEDSRSLGSVTGGSLVGGLVGENMGSIIASYAMGLVLGRDELYVGGLVGRQNLGGTIKDSHSLGPVTGGSVVGGLVGWNTGSIIASYATGTVTGTHAGGKSGSVGGLVGFHSGVDIRSSYAIGKVFGAAGSQFVGGLVGFSLSDISDSYATGEVVGAGSAAVGGLVGYSAGIVIRSFATGAVSGNEDVGGLVGSNAGIVSDSYTTGLVSGNKNVGGLVGSSTGNTTIRHSYSLSTVTGTEVDESFGGLVGSSSSSIIASYYTGRENDLGEFRTRVQLRCPTRADARCPEPDGPATYDGWDPDIWDFGSGNEFPKLRSPVLPDVDGQLRIKVYLGGATR